ncbi:DUF1499 domain-containing protein [Rhodohalobacter sulfatireducens]|uniref:DUF1499 domain-containing protein n=1 Tax=Rhodohalobacter sulfatireducens TaxID=2911366 RepID=A0ABS9K9P0_9BACT|nr:DUF1499 domain-containing protein [Rhodohalobacter sulfatireducens]MCG2587562.1 DUF1499 domain-containing protein [Rhodohalobacter sulfatireducens]
MLYSRILFYLSLLAVLVFIASGYGYNWEIWSLGMAFTLLTYSAYATIALALIGLISIWFLRKGRAKAIVFAVLALLLTGSVSITALYWQQRAQSVPPIHDITTDIENPPEFSAMLRLRADAPNPPEYAGPETAEAQREAYPEIQPIILPENLQDVMDAAVMLITDREWKLVAINRNQGRIEATEKLAWFGFKDDVVLRFTETAEGTLVDMRSKSRIGRGDVGVNAQRIEEFLEDLEDSVD